MAGSNALCPPICNTFPNSPAWLANVKHLHVGRVVCQLCRMACAWNSDLTVCGLDLTIRTLCFNAYLLYAFTGDTRKIFRTKLVMTILGGRVRFGTTMVPHN